MDDVPGMIRPDLQALPQVRDRMTFLYLEHCTLGRQDGAITVTDEKGIVQIPATGISVLLLGPGTRVTHRACLPVRAGPSVIVALGCAPGLGFVHVGHECSFVYDIADLYKAEVTIPIAFEVAAQAPEDLPAVVRRRVRDAMVEHHILERMVHDIRWLLLTEEEQTKEPDVVYLWDNKVGAVSNGINYFDREAGEEPS